MSGVLSPVASCRQQEKTSRQAVEEGGSMIHCRKNWRQATLACTVAALACTALGLCFGSLPGATARASSNTGSSSSVEIVAAATGWRDSLPVSRQRPTRILLQQKGSPDPALQLGWLQEPPGGWPSWETPLDEPAGSEDGVVVAAAATAVATRSQPSSKSSDAAKVVVEQVAWHLSTAAAAQEARARAASAALLLADLQPQEISTRSLPVDAPADGAAAGDSHLPDVNTVAIAAAAAAKGGDSEVLSTAAFTPKQSPKPSPRPPPKPRPKPRPPPPKKSPPPRPRPRPIPRPKPKPPAAKPSPRPSPRPAPKPAPKRSPPPPKKQTTQGAGASPAPKPPPGLATLPNTVYRAASLPPPFHGDSPPTGLVRPAAALPGGCPGGSSVMRFGARGNGVTSDVLALRYADRSPGVSVLYFPVGAYRITANLVLSKPVLMGARTRFIVDAGVKLTLSKPPRRAPIWFDPMFTGAGKVQMGNGVAEVYPAWWSDFSLSDDQVLQLAIRSCLSTCTVLQSRSLFLQRAVTLSPTVGVFSTANAGIAAARQSTGEGLVLPAGSYRRPMVLTSVRSFSRFGVKVMGGVRDLDLQAGHITDNGDGILFQGAAGRAAAIFNTTVSHVSVMQSNQQTVAFSSPAPGATFAGVTVRINFLLTGGFQAPSQPSAGVLFRGAPPELRRTQVIVQTSGPVSNFVFRSDCWNGGYAMPGTQVSGAFRNSSFRIFFSDLVGGGVWSFKAGSANNWVSKQEAAAPATFWSLVGAPGTLAQFIGANPGSPPQPFPLQFASPVRHQSFWVALMTGSDWAPGQQLTYYLHTYFASPALSGSRMGCIPFQRFNPGIYCLSVASAPLPNEPYRVAIKLINLSRKVLPAQSAQYFGVQIGPG
ncbi:expressed protein [Chlorella variabilis]|uniref:Expressed protein n=1 Tax=Chlorella variabilis TaxID=554065 RepID=E1Z895_CHLVA|nr:expressed protein [Chlorella variabilis]EFN58055.1 expressed protein [Chlorella variabilis]|eukprot:XP_005850157.1 expressed protein [Chlorella variabilis]